MNPKITVLMPAYNAEKYVREAIESILDQTYSNFELLIADDASTDSTKLVIENIPDDRITCYHNTENLGKTETVNKLFKHARGELITIHDADDYSMPKRFEFQVQAFRNDSALGMCGTSFISVNESGTEILETVQMKGEYIEILSEIGNCSQFHGPTMMIKKAILDDLGEVYRPYFKNNYEDSDLAYRIAEKNVSYNLPKILYKYRILPNSLCRKKVDTRNRNLYKVVSFLAQERAARGRDSLADGNPDVVDVYLREVTKKYSFDTSLAHREAASYFMYWKLYRRAINESWLATIKNPMQFVNYRTLLYCVKKYLFKGLDFSRKDENHNVQH